MREAKAIKVDDDEILSEMIIKMIQDKGGENIIRLNLSEISDAVVDYFIICHAYSKTHVKSIGDFVEVKVKEMFKSLNLHVEGRNNGEWVLIGAGNILVHIFLEEKREYYQLEDLWSDAEIKKYDN
ncbi:MAG: ribosome silencing factor [Chitinophagales bacterium]|nr:ribosome silencing factor [Chitinophagales bacterium]